MQDYFPNDFPAAAMLEGAFLLFPQRNKETTPPQLKLKWILTKVQVMI